MAQHVSDRFVPRDYGAEDTLPYYALRPSWPARLRLFSVCAFIGRARDLRDPEAQGVAEWYAARARCQFREALWADEAAVA